MNALSYGNGEFWSYSADFTGLPDHRTRGENVMYIHRFLDERALVVVNDRERINALITAHGVEVESATDSERGVVMRLARVTDEFVRRLEEIKDYPAGT